MIKDYKKFKEEHKEELESLNFYDVIMGFIDKMIELGVIDDHVEYTRNYNGKIIYQVQEHRTKVCISNKIRRNRLEKKQMKEITIEEINKIFGTRIELKNIFLDEIYYPYFM